MTPQLHTAELPPLSGSPWLTQGAYGDAGNLELVAPAADGGFWVFWFNADPVDHQQGAARRCWSGGLHVFTGHQVQAVRITQVAAGPNYLEALALTDAALHRLHWTPDAGFVPDGVIAQDIADVSAGCELDGRLCVAARRRDGSGVELRAPLDTYPRLTWTESAGAAQDWTRTALHLHLDAAGRLLDDHHVIADLGAHAVTACRTTLDGGRTDVVLALGSVLVHLFSTGSGWSAPQRIVSTVWVTTPSAPIHRRVGGLR